MYLYLYTDSFIHLWQSTNLGDAGSDGRKRQKNYLFFGDFTDHFATPCG